MNGPMGDEDYEDAQRKYILLFRVLNTSKSPFDPRHAGEANKLIADYRYKLQKAEQEIASLQSTLARTDTQLLRYKTTADASEKAEAELKIERRKLQREVIILFCRSKLQNASKARARALETSNVFLLSSSRKMITTHSAYPSTIGAYLIAILYDDFSRLSFTFGTNAICSRQVFV